MNKFKFVCENDSNGFTPTKLSIVHEVEAESLFDVIEYFEMFLRGCGYVFDGKLELVEEET